MRDLGQLGSGDGIILDTATTLAHWYSDASDRHSTISLRDHSIMMPQMDAVSPAQQSHINDVPPQEIAVKSAIEA